MQAVIATATESLFGLDGAVLAWRKALGAEFVVTERAELNAAQTTTFSTRQEIPVILRPANREQVQECLRIANQFRVPVYPVSSGLNWGYGSKVPDTDGLRSDGADADEPHRGLQPGPGLRNS